jgi:hypothetical protein
MLDTAVPAAPDFDDTEYLLTYGHYTLSTQPRLEIATATFLFCICIGLLWTTYERSPNIWDDLAWLELSALVSMCVHLFSAAFSVLIVIEEGTARVAHWAGMPASQPMGFDTQTIVRLAVIFVAALSIFCAIVVLTHSGMDLFFPKLRFIPFSGGG